MSGWLETAFAHPVTRLLTLVTVAALVLAPLLILALRKLGKTSDKLHAELLSRWRTWCILAPLMLGPVLLGRGFTIAAICLLSLACYREYSRATGLFREKTVSLLAVTGILAVAFAAADRWYGFFMALGPLTVSIIAAVEVLRDKPKGYIQRTALGVFGFLFFGFSFGHLAFLANDERYRPLLLALLFCVELNDIAGFVIGKPLGKRKLIPETSPGKTLAGAVGALVFTCGLTLVLMHQVFAGTALDRWPLLLTLGVIISVGGQLGDLMLSSIKRDVGIKDFDVLLPGHGGLLDRFDSFVLVAPAVFHFVRYFGGVSVGH